MLLTLPAMAQQDPPEDALVGNFYVVQHPVVDIDGKQLRLSPAARIYMPNRLIVTSNYIESKVRVRYTLDSLGDINRVWVIGEPVYKRVAPPSHP